MSNSRTQYALTPKGLSALHEHAEARARACPVCETPAGFNCVVAGTGKPRLYMHASRYIKQEPKA